MKTLTLCALFALTTINAQKVFWENTGGTFGKDLNFSAGLTVDISMFAIKANYVYSNHGEPFAIMAGVKPYENDWFKSYVFWGHEINKDNAKVSAAVHFKVAPGVWALGGVESVMNKAYYNAGLSLRVADLFINNKRNHRFY